MNSTLEDFEYITWASMTASSVNKYLCLIIMPMGVFFNFLEILIFRMKKFSKTTMGFYFSLNSILNIIIILHLFVYLFSALFQTILILESNFSCQIYNFILRVLYQASSWLNVIITADRFIFIIFPNKFEFQKNYKIIFLILFGLFGFICLTNIPNFFMYIVTINPNSTAPIYTNRLCTSTSDILLIRNIQTITMRTALPFTLMLIMNLILVFKVTESKKRLNINKSKRQELRFLFTVIASTFIFLISFIPNIVWLILSNLFQTNNAIKQRMTYSAFLLLLELSSTTVAFINYSFNIFIHLAFNKIFRNEILKCIAFNSKCFGRFNIRPNESSITDKKTPTRN